MPGAPASVILQDRDIAFLRGLFECRVMKAVHIASLYFGGHQEYTKKRLQVLKSGGLIAERPRKQFEPSVLFLAPKGREALRSRGVLHLYPVSDMQKLARRVDVSDLTLGHELSVVDLKAAFHAAARGREDLSILEFSTWPLLNKFVALGQVVKPDGFVRIRERTANGQSREHTFYLELDCSTESLECLHAKARRYLAHYKSRRLATRDSPSAGSRGVPFQVLFVLSSPERRDSIAQHLILSSQPIFSLVLLTTLSELKCDPFGAMWKRPMDYRYTPNPTSSIRCIPTTMNHKCVESPLLLAPTSP